MSGSWRDLDTTAASHLDFDDPLAAEDSVHPYFGFVRRPKEQPEPGTLPINEFGFIDDNSPIQHREKGKVIVGIVGGSLAQEFCQFGLPEFEAQLERSRDSPTSESSSSSWRFPATNSRSNSLSSTTCSRWGPSSI